MSYQLGDRVTYQSRSPKYNFNGTIVGFESWGGSTKRYIIEPDEPQVSKGNLWFSKCFVFNSQKRLQQYFNGTESKKKCTSLSAKAKGLMPGMYDYVPTQEGDKDDDI